MSDFEQCFGGGGGMGAVFPCSACGKSFVRTLPGQDRCSRCIREGREAIGAGSVSPHSEDSKSKTLFYTPGINGFHLLNPQPGLDAGEPAPNGEQPCIYLPHCPTCGTPNHGSHRFCGECGTKLFKVADK